MTIVNIRGTHGSGKSTIATRIMNKYGYIEHIKISADGMKARTAGYIVPIKRGETLFIVGKYETACGGCDGIQPYSDIWPRVAAAAEDHHHVLFEGALISTTYGSIGQESEFFGNDFVFAFMDTPLEECVRRVNARRAARGAGPIEDIKNIAGKHATIAALRSKLMYGHQTPAASRGEVPKRKVADIDHTQPLRTTLKLFGVRLDKEPS